MKKNWWSSLQVKVIAWSFVPTVILLTAMAWFIFYSYQRVQELESQAIKHEEELIREQAIHAMEVIANLVNLPLMPVITSIDTHYDLPFEARARNILNRAQGLEDFDGGIYFLNQQGEVVKTHPDQPELVGQDWSDNPQLRHLKDNPTYGGIFTDLLTLQPSGKKILCLVQAMIGQEGETVGAGYYCFTIYPATQNTYYQDLTEQNLVPNFYIVDGSQNIIYSPDPSEMGKDISGEAYVQQLLQEESQSGWFRDRTADMLINYLSLSSDKNIMGWIAISKGSWAEIMQPTRVYRQLLFILLALGVIVPVLVTAYGARHITNPIQKLIQAAEQVTAGQFKQRIEVNTGDEIETLADQFNLMSAKLDDSYSSLEKKVADRTRELAIMNSIISTASLSLDVQEILEDALNKTVEQMGFEAGAAFKLEPDSAGTLLLAQRGFEPDSVIDLAENYPVQSQGNITGHSSTVTTYEVKDQQTDQLAQFGYRLLVSVPLSTKGRTLGLFLLGKRELSSLSPEELALLGSIGKQVGVAMENARLYEQAEQAAIAAERHRLARELHDAVTQTLFSANLIADVLPRIWKRNPDEGLQNLDELRQLTRGALAEMRTMLLEMRPESLERIDIKSLLTQLADAFVGRVRIPVDLEMSGDCELSQDVKLGFYRVAQEALNNIAKHSGARQVYLHLECNSGHMNLYIKDDGLGFKVGSIPPGHMGIAIMRERAGSIGAGLKIESQPGEGTSVELDWRSARKDVTDEHASDYSSVIGG